VLTAPGPPQVARAEHPPDICHAKPRTGSHWPVWTISTGAARCQPTSVETVTTTTIVNLLIGIAVLALLVYRQLQVRPVRANFRLPLILAIIGVVELTQFLQHNRHTDTVFAALAGSLVLAAITGAIRAMTVRVWIQGGQALRQGTWITALLWIVSLGVHLGYDYLVDGKGPQSGLGSASLVLYFAVTYTIQRFILQAKAQRIAEAPRPGANARTPSR
jgi:hypothetical protein